MNNSMFSLKGLAIFCLSLFLVVSTQAQVTTLVSTSFTNNNGSGQATFNFQNTNGYPIKITGIEGVVGVAGANTCDLWYKTTPLSGAPGAISNANGWYIGASGSFTGVANTTTTTTQTFITGASFIIPAGATYALNVAVLNQRYSTIPAGTTTFSAGGCNFITGTNYGYAGGVPPAAPANTPRGWIGKIIFEPAWFTYNDASVKGLVAPLNFCGGSQDVKVRVGNLGHNKIDSLRVNWQLDGITQPTTFITYPLDTNFNPSGNPTDTVLTLATISFPTSAGKVLRVWTSYPNGVADTVTMNDTLLVTLKPSLSGNYTVGGVGANYPTVAAIANELTNFGVCGPVNITVNPGTYSGKALFSNISGVSATNTITLTGTNKNTCILSDSLNDALLVTINTSYFRISKLTVNNKFNGVCAGIAIVGNTTNNKGTGSAIVNCNVNLPNSIVSTSSAIFVSGSATAGANHNMDSITIDSNTTTGGYYGIVVYGNTSSSSAYNRGFLVRNNTITNSYVYGLYMYYIFNPCKVLYNTITMNPANVSTGYGLYYYYCQNSNTTTSTEIIGNKLINVQYMAMYIYYNASTATAPTKIYNNSVLGNMVYSTNYLCYLYTGVAGNFDFLHNTFHVNGSGTTQYGLYYYNTANVNGLNCKNNIFSLYSANGTTLYPAYFSSNPTVNSINYNIYSNTKNTTLGFRGAAFTTANFNTATTGGDSSFNRYPPVVSASDLHLTDGCTRGVNMSSAVPTDYDGNPRSVSPNPGAYEFSSFTNDLTVDVLYNPSLPVSPGLQNLVCRVKNSGSNTVTNFNISYKLNGGTSVTIPWTGTLNGCDTVLITFTGINQITIASGTNNIKVFTDSPNSSTDGNLTNDTLRATFIYSTPLSGNYTIGGASANYPTFADATFALQNSGISGPVNFTVNPGTYTVPVVLTGPVYGTSATNTITFDGVSAATRSIVVSAASPAFMVNQVSYVTIKNLTVTNTIAGTGSGIALIGNTSGNTGVGFTVKKCIVNMPNTGTSTSYGIIVTGTSTGISDGNQWADSVTIDSNTVVGAYYGIQISTSGNLNASYNRGHKIRWNTLTNTYYYGIRFYYIANPADIIGNNISMLTSNASSYGIYFYYNQHTSSTPSRVIGNTINAGYVAVYYYYWTTGSAPSEFYNNIFTTYGSSYALYLYTAATGGGNINFLNNSVSTQGGSALYGLYYYNSTGTGTSYFKNNIFHSNGSTTYPAYFSTNPTGNVINYNNYYNAAGGNLIYRGAAYTASTYKTATAGGDSSFNTQPFFLSSTNLRLNNGCVKGVDLGGLVPTDIDNNLRGTPPVVGAHEAGGLANDLTIEAYSYAAPIVAGSKDLNLRIRNLTGNTCTSFNIKYSINGGSTVTYPWTGTLNGCDTISVTLSGSNALNLSTGTNAIVVYTANPNSSIDNNPINDTIKFTLSTVSFVPGNALNGNGSAKYIKVNHDPKLNVGTNMTIEAWVYLTDPATRNQKLYSKTKLPTTGNGYILGIENGQLHPEYWDLAGTKTTHNSTATVAANTWTHVAVTWESGVALKSYINGQLVASSPLTSTNPIGFNTSELSIGIASWDFGSFPVNGMVDEFRMWNTTLDSTTIRKNMHRMVDVTTPGLVAYYQFNEPTSATQVGDPVSGLSGSIVGSSYITTSTIPAGGDSAYVASAITSGSYGMKSLGVILTDPFDNATDLVMNEVPLAPNTLPTGAAHVLSDRYWIVNPIGNPGTYAASLSIALTPFQISSTDTAMRLYGRSAYGIGPWTLVQTVGSANISGGAVTFNNVSNFGQFMLASNGNSPLPVTLLSFGGNRVGEDVNLNWITANETNNRGFSIERGINSLDFEEIGFVSSKVINSNKKVSYAFADPNAPNTNLYYRLKQLDMDGKYSYSPIVSIKGSVSEPTTVAYPNPFSNKIYIDTKANETVLVTIYDVQGRKVWTKEIFSAGRIEIPAANELESGIYFIQLNEQQAVKLVKE
ncbi:MAG: hypothetical protein CFE21_11460 [Bacteroidetes bacterium B1(2017)]|nr:MAG: hypothetical protein CFE21_11460 [Bacteroidetes bacterium B1(2017)]